MVVLVFFDIFHGLEDRKISTKCTIHSCSLSLMKLTLICFSQYNFFFALNMAWNLVFFCWKFLVEISSSVLSDTSRSRIFKIQTYICVLSWINITDRQLLPHNTLQQTKRTTGQWTLLSGHYWNWNNLDSHHENLRITNNLNNPISGHKMSVIYLKMQHKYKYDFENTCFRKYQTDCLQVQLKTELLLL